MSISELLYPVDFKETFFEIKTRFSPDIAPEICQLYKKGCSLSDIAKLHGCSKSKVRSHLIKFGIELRETRAQATPLRRLKPGKQAARLYFGFCYFEGQIIQDPHEFSTLQVIHRLWKQKKSIHQITQELNRTKVPSRMGKVWSWAAVQNIVARFENKSVLIKTGGKYELR